MGTSVAPTIAASLILGALIYKASDLAKYVRAALSGAGKTRADGINGLVSLGISTIVGELVVFLFRETQWAGEITIGQRTLADLSTGSLIVFGLVVTSVAASLYDIKKAVDNTDSAATPRYVQAVEKERLARQAQELGTDRSHQELGGLTDRSHQ